MALVAVPATEAIPFDCAVRTEASAGWGLLFVLFLFSFFFTLLLFCFVLFGFASFASFFLFGGFYLVFGVFCGFWTFLDGFGVLVFH